MAVFAKQSITGSEPPWRSHTLIPVRSKKALAFLYVLFFVPMVVWSLVFPLTGLVFLLVRYRVKHHNWSKLFTGFAFGSALFGLFWYSLVFTSYAGSVLPLVGSAGWLGAVASRPFVNLLGTFCYGVAAGLIAYFWYWQRTGDNNRPDRKPTVPQFLSMMRDRDAIANGTYSRQGHIALGLEDGEKSLGRVIEVPISKLTHTLVFGDTGTGKTETCFRFVEGFSQSQMPVISLDMKGSQKTTEAMRLFAEANGRPFYMFTMTGGGRWDPLRALPDSSSQRDLLMATGRWDNSYYRSLASTALLDILSALQVGGYAAGESSLQAVYRMLEPAFLVQYARQKLTAPEHGALRDRVMRRAQEMAENPNAFSGLRSVLEDIVHSISGQFFVPGEGMFSLRQAYEEGAVVHFSIDTKYGDTAKYVSSMVISDVNTLGAALMAEKRSEPWLFWVDEFTKARADYVATMLQQIRESGCRVLLSTQGLGDIGGAGLHSAEGAESYESIVLDQTGLKIFHTVKAKTAQWLEDNSGDRWIEGPGTVETTRKDSLLDADTGASGDRGFKQRSIGPGVKVSEVTSLAAGCAILMGKFDVGHLRPMERPARRTFHEATSGMTFADYFNPVKVIRALMRPADPVLVVNYCAIVRSATGIAAEAAEPRVINEVDLDAVVPVAPRVSAERAVLEDAAFGGFSWPDAQPPAPAALSAPPAALPAPAPQAPPAPAPGRQVSEGSVRRRDEGNSLPPDAGGLF